MIALEKDARRLTVFIGESDRWQGKPLYLAILERLKAEGLAGATVTRGVAGFGAHSRIHTAAILRLSEDLPMVIEVVDERERIERAVEFIAPMVREGLMVVEEVQVVKYTHRYLNPLPADRPLREVMTEAVVTVTPDMPVVEAWNQMLAHGIKGLPVVDENRRVVGMLTDEDLIERAGLRQRLSVAERLEPELLEEEIAALRDDGRRVREVMSRPVVTVRQDEHLGAAAALMAEKRLKRLPVVDDDGRLVGVVSRVDVLCQVTDVAPRRPAHPVAADAGGVARDIMDERVPQIHRDTLLPEIVAAFVQSGSHRLIVVDDEGAAIGLISDADVVARIRSPQRRGILRALRLSAPPPADSTPAADLMSRGVLTVTPDTPIVEAASRMMSAGRKWMVVVDENHRPLGLIDRQILLRALAG